MQKERSFPFMGAVVFSICALFFMYEFFLRTVVGTFQHPLMYDLHLSSLTFALISTTAYFVFYGLMQLPAGIMTDRFGLKRSLFIGALICSLSSFGFSGIQGVTSAASFRILMGIGSSFGFICLLVAVYDWMPKAHRAFFIGLAQFIGTMGPILAAGPMHDLVEERGIAWRWVFFFLGIVGFALSIIILLLVKNNRSSAESYVFLQRIRPLKRNLQALFSQRQVWAIALFSASSYITLEYLSENEGKSFFLSKGVSSSLSSYMISIAWIGYAIGCPLLGFLSDWVQRRKPFLICSAVLCAVPFFLIVYLPLSPLSLVLLFFLFGIGASGQSVGFAIMAENCGKQFLAAGLGLNNFMITFLSAINAPIIGGILDSVKEGKEASLSDYQLVFSLVFILICLGGFLSVFVIKETFCKSVVEVTFLKKDEKL